jgi:ABC-type multidrug transport system ATPase subunit/pSer/pThr/pTyr-binding forkhead associated (FHA) protein
MDDRAKNIAGPLIMIRIVSGPATGRTFESEQTIVQIGRDFGNDLMIDDPTVSRQHACISWTSEGQWQVENISPRNTLTVNQRVATVARLQSNDVVSLSSKTSFIVLLRVPGLPPKANGQDGQNRPDLVAHPVPDPQGSVVSADPLPTIAVSLPVQPPTASPRGTQIAPPLEGQDQQGRQSLPSLEISTNTRRESRTYQLNKAVITIGREPGNDIVINERTVSGSHAQIVREGDQLVLLHPAPGRERTLNGLLYQGRKIGGEEKFRKALSRGDIFRIGDENGTLVTLKYHDGTADSQDILPELHPIPLRGDIITLGRLPDNTAILNHPQVSSHHARLVREGQSYRIIDLGSTNHIYVNSQKVREQQLKVNDIIRIGPFKLTYTGTQLTQQDESNNIRIDALHLRKTGGKNVVLLNDISLVIPPRTFVALVGGSGTGKSTLLDALNGLRPAQKGIVLYNGQDYYKNLAAFSTQLGYVPQDDIIHRDLTVERALYYAARLRLPEDFTIEQIRQRIDEVLEDVEMKHRRRLLVSKLSGGQRKRISIALELLANPSVFFLDEPTSGLDPGLDSKMMLLLRRLADRGHTIVLVTHATSNINVCDFVCFLAQGGRLAYYGPPTEAPAYFNTVSFAEIYSALEPTDEQPNIPEEAEERFKSSPYYQRYIASSLAQRAPGADRIALAQETVSVDVPARGGRWRQFWLLSFRYLELLKNDPGNLTILLLQAPVIAIILMFIAGADPFAAQNVVTCPTRENIVDTSGSIVSNDCQRVIDFLNTPAGLAVAQQQGESKDAILQDAIAPSSGIIAQEVLFILAFAAVMFGCINAAREIVKEGHIYRRERTVNLRIVPYMFSKIAVLGVLCLLQSAILVLMVNITAPFKQGVFLPPLLEVYITLALTSLTGLMIGLTVSAVAPNTDRAMSFVPIILIPQVIFSGIIFTFEDLTSKVIGGFFAVRWAVASLGSSMGLHGDKLGVDDVAYCGTLFSTCADATKHLLLLWAVLLLMIVVLGVVVALFLKRKDIRRS